MIFQKVMNNLVRQAIALCVVIDPAIWAAPKQASERTGPQRTVAVFKQIKNEDLFRSQINRHELETILGSLQTIDVLHRSAPDRAVTILEQHIDSSGPTVFILWKDHCEHRRGCALLIGKNN